MNAQDARRSVTAHVAAIMELCSTSDHNAGMNCAECDAPIYERGCDDCTRLHAAWERLTAELERRAP